MNTRFLALCCSLGATRIVALTMPFVDLVLLAHFAPDRVSAFAVGAQWAQIGVVACGTIGVAVSVILPRCIPSRRITWTFPFICASVYVGVTSTLVTLAFRSIPFVDPSSTVVLTTLAYGMLPLCAYSALAAIEQCQGRANYIFRLTVFAGVLNIVLDWTFITLFDAAFGVALATAICWSLLFLILSGWRLHLASYRKRPRDVAAADSGQIVRRGGMRAAISVKVRLIFRILLPDFLSKLAFLAGIAVGLTWVSASLIAEEAGWLAAALNYMNVVFVFIAASTIAFNIVFSTQVNLMQWKAFAWQPLILLTLLGGLLVVTLPGAAWTYLSVINTEALTTLGMAGAAVLADGVSMFAIAFLRMRGAISWPPYLRLLMFPYAACHIYYVESSAAWSVLESMMIGNALAALALIVAAALVASRAVTAQRLDRKLHG